MHVLIRLQLQTHQVQMCHSSRVRASLMHCWAGCNSKEALQLFSTCSSTARKSSNSRTEASLMSWLPGTSTEHSIGASCKLRHRNMSPYLSAPASKQPLAVTTLITLTSDPCADGDFKLTESAVVVEYLDNKYGHPGNRLLPEDPEEHSLVCCCSLFVCLQRIHPSLSSCAPHKPCSIAVHHLWPPRQYLSPVIVVIT